MQPFHLRNQKQTGWSPPVRKARLGLEEKKNKEKEIESFHQHSIRKIIGQQGGTPFREG
jgi:hypothetical protein